MLGLEQALAVVIDTMLLPGRMDWAGIAQAMSVRPAEIGRRPGHGRPIAAGEPANLVLVDPSGRAQVDPVASASRSRNNPYAGRDLPTPVVATFLRGRATVLEGALVDPT
jgi:dihydroorotase